MIISKNKGFRRETNADQRMGCFQLIFSWVSAKPRQYARFGGEYENYPVINFGAHSACVTNFGAHSACVTNFGAQSACLTNFGAHPACVTNFGAHSACVQ
jgi:hypothetical protein